MVTLVAIHWMGAKKQKEGLQAFKENSDRAKKAKGFVSRIVLKSTTNPEVWTTVTTWETMEDYNNFQNDPNRVKHATPLFDKLERDVYTVDESLSLNVKGKK